MSIETPELSSDGEFCPCCNWKIVSPTWQLTADGKCRRCGYDPATDKASPLDRTDLVYSPKAIADLCKISRRRVYDWLAEGWLRSHQINGRWFVTDEDLRFFIDSCRGAAGRLMPQLWDWEELWSNYSGAVQE